MGVIEDYLNKTKTLIDSILEKHKGYSVIENGVLVRFDKRDLVDGCYTIPSNVVKIGENAFELDKDILKIEIPKSVKEIETGAFRNCSNLQEVILNEGLVKIGSEAFKNSGIEKIIMPETVDVIDRGCFFDCENLQTCQLPKQISYLGACVFAGCEKLKYVNIPENLEELPFGLFVDCASLKTVILPDGLKKISGNAFKRCRSLKHISFPETVESIGADVFMGCIGLTSVKLPSKLKVLELATFQQCYALEKVKLPEGLIKIGSRAFSLCRALKKLTIPSSVEKISKDAFSSTPIRRFVINGKEIELHKGGLYPIGALYPFYNYATKHDLFIPKHPEIMVKTKPEEIENFYKYSTIWKKILDRYLEIQKEYEEFFKTNVQAEEIIGNLYQVCVVLGLFQNLSGKKRKELNEFLEKNILIINPLDLHRVFSGFQTELYGYNKEFAEFYIKNYMPPIYDKEGNVLYFMEVAEDYYDDNFDRYYDADEDEQDLDDIDEDCFDPEKVEIVGYVEQAYNHWKKIKEVYPNKTVLNHRERASENNNLTFDDVLKALNCVEYENVHEGNEEMAELVGHYGYTQGDFDRLQEWWDKGKTITPEQKSLKLTEDTSNNGINYHLFKNDEIEVLIQGEETNCCLTVDDAAWEALRYGITKPNSGFIKFIYKGRIIGASWVWYNKKTKTVCLDNIEIPTLWIKRIKKHKELEQAFIGCLKKLAKSFVNSMNIDKVTIGAGFNDLSAINEFDFIDGKFSPPPADYGGYTDANGIQFILYDRTINKTKQQNLEDDKISFDIPPTSVETF